MPNERFPICAGQENVRRPCANAEAVAHFSRALDLALHESVERYALLLARQSVYCAQDDREAQDRDLATLEQLVDILGDKSRQAEVAVHRARFCIRTGERGQAVSAAQAAVCLARDAQDVGLEAMAYREWGQALASQKKHEAARSYLERSLDLARGVGLPQVEAEVLHALGAVLHNLGDDEKGLECYERALRICRQTGDRRREAEALHAVGWVLLLRVNWTESEAYL